MATRQANRALEEKSSMKKILKNYNKLNDNKEKSMNKPKVKYIKATATKTKMSKGAERSFERNKTFNQRLRRLLGNYAGS